MMDDYVAAGIAMDAAKKASSGGGTVDAYTKAQIDAKLAEKADKSDISALQTEQAAQDDAISAVKSLLENALINREIISGGSRDNFDDFIETGIYRYQGGPLSCPNTSVTGDYGIVLILRFSNYIVQFAFSNLTNMSVYVRSSVDSGTSWFNWKKLPFVESVSNASADSPVLDRMEMMEQIEVPEEVTTKNEEEEKYNERKKNL